MTNSRKNYYCDIQIIEKNILNNTRGHKHEVINKKNMNFYHKVGHKRKRKQVFHLFPVLLD